MRYTNKNEEKRSFTNYHITKSIGLQALIADNHYTDQTHSLGI